MLDRAGYARYDGRTSRLLGGTSECLPERYRADLRRLRAEAARVPDTGLVRVALDSADDELGA